MDQWDPAAGERLQDIVGQLRAAGVIEVFEQTIAHVWRANVARYEPSDLGDTTRSLGVTATENIRELMLRQRWSPAQSGDLGQDVHVTAPNDSLLIVSSGVNIRSKKAMSMVNLAEPNWDGFDWTNESDVRQAAARNNRARYNPFQIGSGTLFDGVLPVEGNPKALCDVLLVWAGGSSAPYTGGWIGLPTLGADRPWLAVQRLWWHRDDGNGTWRKPCRPTDPDVDTFERRPFPQPEIRVKPRRQTAEQ